MEKREDLKSCQRRNKGPQPREGKGHKPKDRRNHCCACASRERVWAWPRGLELSSLGSYYPANCESAFDGLSGKEGLVWD